LTFLLITGQLCGMTPVLRYRRATARDASRLSQIAFTAKQSWGYPNEWMEIWRPELTIGPDLIRREQVTIASEQQQIVGFFTFVQRRGMIWLDHFWVRPGSMGRGFGRAMFGEMKNQARRAGWTVLQIESDPHAESFYLKMGAVRIGTDERVFLDQTKRSLPVLAVSLD
jgi:GNAT superfamily N-acetyltransferase